MNYKNLTLVLVGGFLITVNSFANMAITFRGQTPILQSTIHLRKCADGKFHMVYKQVPTGYLSNPPPPTALDYVCGTNSLALDAGTESIQTTRDNTGAMHVALNGKVNGAPFVSPNYMALYSMGPASVIEAGLLTDFARCLNAIKAGLAKSMQIDIQLAYAPQTTIVRCESYDINFYD